MPQSIPRDDRREAGGGHPDAEKRFYAYCASADKATIEFRKWWRTYGMAASPASSFGPASFEDLSRQTRAEMIDPWRNHARQCASCRDALKTAGKVETGGLALAAAALLLLPGGSLQRAASRVTLCALGGGAAFGARRVKAIIQGESQPAAVADRSVAALSDAGLTVHEFPASQNSRRGYRCENSALWRLRAGVDRVDVARVYDGGWFWRAGRRPVCEYVGTIDTSRIGYLKRTVGTRKRTKCKSIYTLVGNRLTRPSPREASACRAGAEFSRPQAHTKGFNSLFFSLLFHFRRDLIRLRERERARAPSERAARDSRRRDVVGPHSSTCVANNHGSRAERDVRPT